MIKVVRCHVVTFIVFTERSECILEVCLEIEFFILLLDDHAEIVEVQGSGAIVNLVDQVLHLHICWVLASSPHCVLEVLGEKILLLIILQVEGEKKYYSCRNGAIFIPVKVIKGSFVQLFILLFF